MKLTAAIAAYATAILAANILTDRLGLVPVGFGLLVTAGTYAAGLSLLARDIVHRVGGPLWALASVAVGIALSWLLASPALAIASAAAFGVAELIDLAVYHWLRPRGFIRAAFVSNAVSAPIDTVVFLALAGFPLTVATVGGQYIGKVLWATAIPLAIYGAGRALLRKPEHAAST